MIMFGDEIATLKGPLESVGGGRELVCVWPTTGQEFTRLKFRLFIIFNYTSRALSR